MLLPVSPFRLPADLVNQLNGELPQSLLTPCGIGNFKMHRLASRALKALLAAYPPATETATGTYRTYAQQVQLFEARYTTTKLPGRPTKVWNQVTWWQKPGVAMAAVPGTSNHGYGLAIDFAEELDGDPAAESVSAEFVAWLCANAWRYGYSAESQSENWHWRYFAGDQIPVAVLEYESGPPLIIEGDEEMAKAIQVAGDPAIFAATSALTAVWMRAGVDVALDALDLVERRADGSAFPCDRSAFKGLELRGPCPGPQDGYNGPTFPSDFAKHTP